MALSPNRVMWVLYGLIVVGTPIALGGLHTPVLVAAAVATAALLVLVFRYERDRLRDIRAVAKVVLAAGALGIGFTLFQMVPLPAWLVVHLSPETAIAWSRSLSPLREPGPTWMTLSLDPVATRIEALRGATYLGVYMATLVLARRSGSAIHVERVLVVGGILMALVSLAHPLMRADRLFGTYEPDAPYAFAATHIAPLLNVNHLAGFGHIAFCIALHRTLSRREGIAARALPICACALLLATNVWAGSRGGTAALFVGAGLVFGGVLVVRRNARTGLRTRVASTFAALVGGAVVYLAVFTEARTMLLMDTDFTKVRLIRESFALARQTPWFGVGRGAFESTFPVVRKLPGYVVYTHPENLVAQWVTEWGIPVAIVLFVLFAFAMRWSSASARSRPPIGAWAGLWALALHNMVDFSLEVPGVAIVAAAALGIVTSGEVARERQEDGSRLPRVAWGVLATIGTLLGMGVWTLTGWDHELVRERRALFEEVPHARKDPKAFESHVRGAMRRHPAEPYFPYVGGIAAFDRGASAVPWVSRTLERSPVHGRAYLLLARTLRFRVPSQARLAYRIAYEHDDVLLGNVAQEAPALVTSFEDALSLVSTGPLGLRMLDSLASALSSRLPSTAARLDELLLQRSPNEAGPLVRRAEAILADARDLSDRSRLREGSALATRYREKFPSECRGYAIEAEVSEIQGEVRAAMSGLESALDVLTPVEARVCLRILVRLADREKAFALAERAVDRVARMPCSTDEACAAAFIELAALEENRGHARRSLTFYRKAYERTRDRVALGAMAALGMRAKMYGDAVFAYGELARLDGATAAWKEGLESARAAIRQESLMPKPAASAEPDPLRASDAGSEQ